VRSYQGWLDAAIEGLGAEPGPRQAVMARQLTALQKASRAFAVAPLDAGQPEITAPVTQLMRAAHPMQSEARRENHLCNRRR
jgi:hypothetical protein